MIGSRRWFLRTTLAGGIAGLAGCGDRGPVAVASKEQSTLPRIDTALAATTKFFLASQSADGGWHSDVYGPFKEGPVLTPLVLRTLGSIPGAWEAEEAYRKGSNYLAAQIEDNKVNAGPRGLGYPVYTAAGAVQVLSDPNNARHARARQAWLAYLRERQLCEDLGWQPSDKPFGGWGYCPGIPRKPKPGEPLPPLTESNLSATVFALEALHAAGIPSQDPAFQKALVFVDRCQNFSGNAKEQDTRFDDGGFFFIYDDPVRNKAGSAGKDRHGRDRFYSYGSMTADGLRALLLCGKSWDDPRVAAARKWVIANFQADGHPGKYATEREVNRQAVYYYYCCSVALAFRAMDIEEPSTSTARAAALAEELMRRQKPDGTWSNPLVPQREDDPLVATSFAGLALATIRKLLMPRQRR